MDRVLPFKGLMTVGILLAMGPFWGVIGMLVGMVRAFTSIGPGKPEELAESIGMSLWSTTVGMVVCPIGVVLIVLAIVFRRRARTQAKEQPPPFFPS